MEHTALFTRWCRGFGAEQPWPNIEEAPKDGIAWTYSRCMSSADRLTQKRI